MFLRLFNRLGLIFTISVAVSATAVAGEGRSLILWFDAPAEDWESQSLPIGNGAMGATVQGGVDSEVIQFNEKTLWTGGPESREGYDFGIPEKNLRQALTSVQRKLAQKGEMAPEAVAETLGRDPKGYGHYQTFGDLLIDHDFQQGEVHNYRRELDLANGIARVSYEKNGVVFSREYFASYPAGVIVVRLSANQPGAVAFTSQFRIPQNRSVETHAKGSRITVAGQLHDNALRYAAQLHVMQTGGVIQTSPEGHITVKDADSAVLILGAATDYALEFPTYRGESPHARVEAQVDGAAAEGYRALRDAHRRDYRNLFNRVRLDIGQSMPNIPTPQLLEAYSGKASARDRALEHLYFQYGRYLLIASSRAGSLPANLQGVWNDSNTPPWNADYHVNINLQMNYWPADVTNLAETAAPFFTFVESLVEPGRLSAQTIFNADGWTLFLNTNPWGFTGLISWPTAFWQPEAGAWLAHHFYDHYRFTQDETFLRQRAYPIMKSASELWLDALVEDSDGSLVVSPSFSPEHGNFTEAAAMSQQLVVNLLANTAAAAKKLDDRAFHKRLQEALARVDKGLRIGSWGQLQEWKQDRDDPANRHRHISHLFALYPGDQIDPSTTPALANAAKVSLNARGDGGTGWAKAWKINLWARLGVGDQAHKLLAQQLADSTLPNLWSTHPPFQIDGNFGATAGVSEMLVQSHQEDVHLLPALPKVWARQGAVEGLRARGGLIVDLTWEAGELQKASVTAEKGGRIRLRNHQFENAEYEVIETSAGRPVAVKKEGARLSFTAEPGGTYHVRRKIPTADDA